MNVHILYITKTSLMVIVGGHHYHVLFHRLFNSFKNRFHFTTQLTCGFFLQRGRYTEALTSFLSLLVRVFVVHHSKKKKK